MIREEFEAAVWRIAGRRLDRRDIAAIVAAADRFAAAEGGRTAERRAVLALPPVVHFQVPCRAGHEPGQCTAPPIACNSTCWLKRRRAVTSNPAKVTCTRCKSAIALSARRRSTLRAVPASPEHPNRRTA